MSEEIGFIGLPDEGYVKTYSEGTAELIDKAIKNIIDECTLKTREIIIKYNKEITALAETLIEKETLTIHEIEKIIGKRPFEYNESVKEYLSEKELEKAS